MEKGIKGLILIIVATVAFLLACSPVFAATIFSDGFESGDTSTWSYTEGLIVDSSAYHHGNYSGKVDNLGTAYVESSGYNLDTAYAAAYFRFDALNETNWINHELLKMHDGSNNRVSQLYITKLNGAAGVFVWKISYTNSGGSETSNQSEVTINSTVWVHLELKCVVHDTLGEVRLYVDGVETLSIVGADTTYYGNVDTIRFGAVNDGGTKDTYHMDCAVIADSRIGEEIIDVPEVPDAWDEDLNNYFCVAILLVFGFVFMIFMVSRRHY